MALPLSARQSKVLYLLDVVDLSEDPDERHAAETELEELLAGLAQDEEGKLDQYRWLHQRLLGEAQVLADEVIRLNALKKSRKRWADRLKERAFHLVELRAGRTGERKVKTATASYTLAEGPAKVIGPPSVDLWADQGFIRVKEEADRKLALESLKSTHPEEWPEGFTLVRTKYLRW